MTIQHQELAAGRWAQMPLCEQMANIGSEVSRALNWENKNNPEYRLKAAARALELLELSLDAARTYPRLKELARVREAVVDYFYGTNQFGSSEQLWRRYFFPFNTLARRNS